MSEMSRPTVIRWILVLVVLFVAIAFVTQNLSRATPLSLNLGFVAWQLRQPVAVPVLMGICFGGGLLVAGLLALVRDGSQRDRIERLEQELVLARAHVTEGPRQS